MSTHLLWPITCVYHEISSISLTYFFVCSPCLADAAAGLSQVAPAAKMISNSCSDLQQPGWPPTTTMTSSRQDDLQQTGWPPATTMTSSRQDDLQQLQWPPAARMTSNNYNDLQQLQWPPAAGMTSTSSTSWFCDDEVGGYCSIVVWHFSLMTLCVCYKCLGMPHRTYC